MSETTHPLHGRSVGEIAAVLPGASTIFRRTGIDFCCQGHVSLEDAARRRRLDLERLEAALGALDPAAPQPVPQETDALIDYIQTRYHDGHRQQIPELIELSRKVEVVHVNHLNVPAGLAETLQMFGDELEVHMQKQETILFPAMRKKANDRPTLSIREMRHDYNDHADFLDQIARLTDDYTPPDDACHSWKALYAEVAKFRADLLDHVHLESNVLFPRFEAAA